MPRVTLRTRATALLCAASILGVASCGGGSSRSEAEASGSPAGTPRPAFGETVNLQPVSGTVLVELPGASEGNPAAGYVRLYAARQVPVGTLVDTTSGAVRLTAATANPGQVQTGEFHGGIFAILQPRSEGGLTELRIHDNKSRSTACGPAAKAAPPRQLSPRILGLLRGNAKGQFRTIGQFAAATVRGTEWGVRDRCDGTLTVVSQGVVVVHDFRLKKDITVRAGQTYLATAA